MNRYLISRNDARSQIRRQKIKLQQETCRQTATNQTTAGNFWSNNSRSDQQEAFGQLTADPITIKFLRSDDTDQMQ